MKFSSWDLYLLQAKEKYPAHHRMYRAILTLIDHTKSAADNIAKLEKVPQALVLSLEPICKRVTQSFLHQSTALEFLGEEANVVGVIGYGKSKPALLEF